MMITIVYKQKQKNKYQRMFKIIYKFNKTFNNTKAITSQSKENIRLLVIIIQLAKTFLSWIIRRDRRTLSSKLKIENRLSNNSRNQYNNNNSYISKQERVLIIIVIIISRVGITNRNYTRQIARMNAAMT